MILQIPTEAHLSRMYFELAMIGADCIGANKPWPYKTRGKEELLALASDISRFDPRLFDILVQYFISHWAEINPLRIRLCYGRMKTREVLAVIAEFAKEAMSGDEQGYFFEYLKMGLKPVPTQFFFYNLYSPGGRLAERAAEEGIAEYKRWGFLACERPVIDQASRRQAGRLDHSSRRNILKKLLAGKKEIGLKDYLSAIDGAVSRQQALKDIKESGLARQFGSGRGAKWKIAAGRV